jgi:predicted LPLAT superfamily acyltransferase
VLAAALGAPVYWLSCLKAGAQYRLRCELLFERIELPRPQREAVLARVMSAYAQRVEAACRSVPYAWFNFYPFWAAAAVA